MWSKVGIQHTDPSIANFMYNPETGKGVLIDWDLALFIADINQDTANSERTGTIPFMALDLLATAGVEGDVQRLYRHDLESFIWVLIWVFLRYENGKEIGNKLLDRWLTTKFEDCLDIKTGFLTRISQLYNIGGGSKARAGWESEFEIGIAMLDWVKKFVDDRERAARHLKQPGAAVIEQDDPASVYKQFWGITRCYCTEVDYLQGLLAELSIAEWEFSAELTGS